MGWRSSLLAAALLAGCVRPPAPGAPVPAAGDAELVLERAVAVAGPGDFQPSGLALWQGRLFTVCDKNSAAILEIPLAGGAAVTARPAVPIALPDAPRENLDLEGLALDGGHFLVVSEARAAVFFVRIDSGLSFWFGDDFAGPARAAGLLATPGAGFEGVAVLDGRIVLAAERQPRGLVMSTAETPKAWRLADPAGPVPFGRQPDLADLAVAGGRLYGIARNEDALVALVPGPDGFALGRRWSFARAVADHPYADRRFGMAEGLAIDDRHVYVILDNNAVPRAEAPGDRRALLFVFRRPGDL